MNQTDDQLYMARALRLARKGLYSCHPNPRVGCVLVKEGSVIAEGWHQRAGGPHAEIVALDKAGDAARGATAYVTLEPCCHQGRTGPCTSRLIDAGVRRVIAAMRDPNPQVSGRGLQVLRDAGIEVADGVLQSEAARLNSGFILRMSRQRPLVRLKLAMSLDGRTALSSGASRWITGAKAREEVHRLRARSSAILTGVGTVLSDDPRLDVRLRTDQEDPGLEPRRPLRVVVDSKLRTPPTARLFQHPGAVLIVSESLDPQRAGALRKAGAELAAIPGDAGGVDLIKLMGYLAEREINEVHTECGATLAGALLEARLVDELVVFVAPAMLGEAARPLAMLPQIADMTKRLQLEFDDVRMVGGDLQLTLRPSN